METEDINNLSILLERELGDAGISGIKAEGDKLKGILANKAIKTKKEYMLVLERVEQIHQDASQNEEVGLLNKLLAGYTLKKLKNKS